MKKDWERRLEHDRTYRDALVACGNDAPTEPDPPGGYVTVKVKVYRFLALKGYMEEKGHTNLHYGLCKCRHEN